MEQYFEVETEDRKVLNDPNRYIIKPGGVILYAAYQGEIVGTCALKKHSQDIFELSKMGVKPQYQGLQIGKTLAKAIIQQARLLGCKRLFLDSNRKLETAIHLYRKLGFTEINKAKDDSPYQRCDITMEMFLNS
ncbi:GNAT family N-acetyltransferase [Kangiella sp. HZ709]|uniref:GNAT family N-acetyltransferase n=1 Tax=Kangiella sp. HZ709 TaxID=2666328 RepID=UPI00351B970D